MGNYFEPSDEEPDWEALRQNLTERQYEFYEFVHRAFKMGDSGTWELPEDHEAHGNVPEDVHEMFHAWLYNTVGNMMQVIVNEGAQAGSPIFNPAIALQVGTAMHDHATRIACGAFGIGVLWGQKVGAELTSEIDWGELES